MVFPESLGHAAAENKGAPAQPGGVRPQGCRHHASHVDGWIKVPMGKGGCRRITSITNAAFDPNRIVPVWTMVWMKPKMSPAHLLKRAQKPGSPNHSDQCLQRRICGDRLRKEA